MLTTHNDYAMPTSRTLRHDQRKEGDCHGNRGNFSFSQSMPR